MWNFLETETFDSKLYLGCRLKLMSNIVEVHNEPGESNAAY